MTNISSLTDGLTRNNTCRNRANETKSMMSAVSFYMSEMDKSVIAISCQSRNICNLCGNKTAKTLSLLLAKQI